MPDKDYTLADMLDASRKADLPEDRRKADLPEDRRKADLSESERDRIHQKLDELRDMIRDHIEDEKQIAPALNELIALWRASKIIAVFIAGAAALISTTWAAVVWIKEHVRL